MCIYSILGWAEITTIMSLHEESNVSPGSLLNWGCSPCFLVLLIHNTGVRLENYTMNSHEAQSKKMSLRLRKKDVILILEIMWGKSVGKLLHM